MEGDPPQRGSLEDQRQATSQSPEALKQAGSMKENMGSCQRKTVKGS